MNQRAWGYLKSEPDLYTVGFYDPTGKWHADSDWPTREEAARRVHYLNGSKTEESLAPRPRAGQELVDDDQD